MRDLTSLLGGNTFSVNQFSWSLADFYAVYMFVLFV